jgi:NTP pyrophosphatase (non-canonical NTP hydrolase)
MLPCDQEPKHHSLNTNDQNLTHMNDIEEIIQALRKFRDERDWAQFHNAKDLALALNIEAGELLETFLWKAPEQADVDSIKEELADVFTFALLLAEKYDLDVKQIVLDKMEKNARKYPVEKSKGSAKKYTEL